MNILTHRGHAAHQYELWKLPHNFTCVTGLGSFGDAWSPSTRPLHSNVKFLDKSKINIKDYDLAIIHIDEFCFNPPENLKVQGWQTRFDYFSSLDIKKVYVMHGTARKDPELAPLYSKEQIISDIDNIRKIVGDSSIVLNSKQQEKEWNFANSTTIYHGFDPSQFVQTKYKDKLNIYLNTSTFGGRPYVNGAQFFDEIFKKIDNNIKVRLKRQGMARNFTEYLSLLTSRTFFMNLTMASPMPRNRGESLMCGNIVISTSNYDWGDVITHGKDGFILDNAEQAQDVLSYVVRQKPEKLTEIGNNARKKAIELFHIDNYLNGWKKVLYNL